MELKAAATETPGTETSGTTLEQGEAAKAKVTLRDGRSYAVDVSVTAPRPSVELVGKNVRFMPGKDGSNIELASEDQLPQDGQLVFSVRAKSPARLSRDVAIEVASEDEAFSAQLTLANRGLTLADTKVAIATFDPAKTFGFSAFGPLKFRVVSSGVAGDWTKLATLVRLPMLQALQCPAETEQPCKLTGSNLFLVESVSGHSAFDDPVEIPAGFPGRALPVPRPENEKLYLKLRDDPSVINAAALNAEELRPADSGQQEPPSAASQERRSGSAGSAP
jgi:hypothetical protein